MSFDAIVIGGSYAGLSATLTLARARRRVLVIDAGQRRNRFSEHAQNFFGQDGRPPAAIIDDARTQIAAYPTVTFADIAAERVAQVAGGFAVALVDGTHHTAARLILATGMVDELPSIPGLPERWGRSVLHCPYCHGYEVAGGRLGVLAAGPLSVHHAQLIAEWGDVTLLTNDTLALDTEQRATLTARGIAIEEGAINTLVGDAPALAGVKLCSGHVVSLDALFIVTRLRPANDFAASLGCALDDGPLGPVVRVDAFGQTTVSGVLAAGDAATGMGHSIAAAVANGQMAGLATHRSLFFPQQ